MRIDMTSTNYKGYTREMGLTSVGKGWAPLINRVFDKLETIKGSIKIVQVKEKWGGLRIYTDYSNKELDKVIYDAEHESLEVCEVCGQSGKLRGKSWYYTSCDEHVKPGDK
jgi:hypothetical protein